MKKTSKNKLAELNGSTVDYIAGKYGIGKRKSVVIEGGKITKEIREKKEVRHELGL